MVHGTLLLLGGKIRIIQGTHMHTCAHTSTYTHTHICTGAACSNASGSQKSFLQVCSTRLHLSSLLWQDIAETAGVPQTADKPLHPSHRALQELQVNLLQPWIGATASAAVRPEIEDLLRCAHGSSYLKALVLTIGWHLPRAGGSLPEGRRHRPMPLGLGHSPPGQARESQPDGARRKHYQVVGQLRM